MATPRRALPRFLLGLSLLAGCGSAPGPEDPALAAAPGIPMGAPGAVGVSLEGAGVAPAPADTGELDLAPHPLPLPKALPPDPFDPMDGQKPLDAGPGPKTKPPKKKGMQL